MQGLKWHSQENWGKYQHGWKDYPTKDQETLQARTTVGKHCNVLDTCWAWTKMLKKVFVGFFSLLNLCIHSLPRTEKATGNTQQKQGHNLPCWVMPSIPTQHSIITATLGDISQIWAPDLWRWHSCLSPLCYWHSHLQKLPANPASSLSQPGSGMGRSLLWCLSQQHRAQGRNASTTFSGKTGSPQHFTYI